LEVVTTMNQQTQNQQSSNPDWEKRLEHIREFLGEKSHLLDDPALRAAFFAGWNYSEHSKNFIIRNSVNGRYTNVSGQ
jgi:hypothetical protein